MTLRAPPRPVVRLNRRMLAFGAGTLAVAVFGGALWSLQAYKRERNPVAGELYNVDRVSRAESLDQLPKDYSKIPVPAKPAVPVLGEPLPRRGAGHPQLERQRQANVSAAYNDPAHADRLTRLRDAEEAARSTVFFRSSGNGTKSAAAATTTSAAAPSVPVSRQPAVQSDGSADATAQPVDPTAAQNRQEQKAAFVANAGDTATRNLASLQMPVSPYQVMAGSVIPAALVTGINLTCRGRLLRT